MGPDIASGLQTKVAKLNFTWSLTILTLGFVEIRQELPRLHYFLEEQFVLDFKSYKKWWGSDRYEAMHGANPLEDGPEVYCCIWLLFCPFACL